MDHQRQDPDRPQTSRLQSQMHGRTVSLPPALPTVAILCAIAGFVLGSALATKPEVAPSPSGLAVASASVEPPSQSASPSLAPVATPTVVHSASASPAEQAEGPPAGGLTVTQALTDLKSSGLGNDPSSIVLSIRIARFGEAMVGALPADRWVWVFVLRRAAQSAPCGGYAASPAPCAEPETTEMAIFDYTTGEFLEDLIPAYP